MDVEERGRNFSRYHKYAIGARLRETVFEVTSLIVKANNTFQASEREKLLTDLRDKAEDVKICLNAARELKAFNSFKSYNYAAKLAVDVCRQSEGWLSFKSAATMSYLKKTRLG